MTSELRVDNLKGSTTGGSINVLGEGTSATTNLQQGLCKAWVFGGEDASLTESFNIASGLDNGTGDYKYSYINSLSGANNIGAAGVSSDNTDRNLTIHSATTALFNTEIYVQGGSNADSGNRSIIFGDLA